MSTANGSHHPDGGPGKRAPARVDSSTRVNVAFPFSQIKIQEPSDHLLALTALVEELAGLVAEKLPGPEAEALRQHAHELASRTR
jgi:hypothetical protein